MLMQRNYSKKEGKKKLLMTEQSRGIFLTDGLWVCEREMAEKVTGLLAVSGDFG